MTNLFNISETVFFLDPERDRINNIMDISMGKIVGIQAVSVDGGYSSIIYTVERITAINCKRKKRFRTKIHEMSEGSIERSYSALDFKVKKYGYQAQETNKKE